MRHEHIMAALEAAEVSHERPTVDDIAREYARLFPDEHLREAERLSMVGTRKSIKDALRAVANIDEGDESAPQLKLALPGELAPKYLLISGREGFGVVRFDRARKPDLLKAISARETVVGRVRARIDDFKLKLRRLCLSPSFDANEATVGDVLADPNEAGDTAA